MQFDKTLNTEQKRIDFRPPEDLPPPLDRPTDACLFTTALLTAAGKAVQQVLRGSNCTAVLTEVRCGKLPVQFTGVFPIAHFPPKAMPFFIALVFTTMHNCL